MAEKYKEPVLYTKILDQDGNVLLDKTPKTHTVIKDSTAYLLTSAMEDVVKYGTGKLADFGTMPIAGKTVQQERRKQPVTPGLQVLLPIHL